MITFHRVLWTMEHNLVSVGVHWRFHLEPPADLRSFCFLMYLLSCPCNYARRVTHGISKVAQLSCSKKKLHNPQPLWSRRTRPWKHLHCQALPKDAHWIKNHITVSTILLDYFCWKSRGSSRCQHHNLLKGCVKMLARLSKDSHWIAMSNNLRIQ